MVLRFVSGEDAFDVLVHQGRVSPAVALAAVTVLDPATGQCLAEAVAPSPAVRPARVRVHSAHVSLDLALRGARATGWLQFRGRRFEGGGPAWVERLRAFPAA